MQTITINGKSKDLPSQLNLKELIKSFCKDSQHVIAEVNGTIIKNPHWDATIIKHGDSVELVTFVGGG